MIRNRRRFHRNSARNAFRARQLRLEQMEDRRLLATYLHTIGTETFTIVEADPFKTGDPVGNTVQAASPGTPWASTSTSNTDNLWRERAISAFVTGYESIPGATDRLYEIAGADRTNAPEVVTTVSGLAPTANGYEVSLVYVSRKDGNADSGGLLANLNGSAVTPYSHLNNDYLLHVEK